MNRVNKDTVRNVLIISMVFIFFFGLAYMFPYTGDDWAWGGSLGIERLHNFFKDYNGRYLGNLLVIVLTRSNILKAVVMSGVITGTVYLIYKTVKNKSTAVLFLALIGLLVMPRYIFRQTIAWTSGFTNYVVPTFLIITYVYLITKVFDGTPKFKKPTFIATFILAICTALFMENITIYQVIADILILFFTFIIYKKLFAPIVSHLFGSVIGCVIMFTNGAYHKIAESNDDYRTLETSSAGILMRIKENLFSIIRKDLALNNVILNIFITIVCIAIVFAFFKKADELSLFRKAIIHLNLFIIISYTAYSVCRVIYPNWNIFLGYTKYFESLFVVLFGLSLIFLSLLCVKENGIKLRLCFYIISIAILTAPLFVVTPVRSRCFYCGYVFFVLFLCEAFGYIFNKQHELIKNNGLVTVLASLCIFACIFYLTVYGYIFKAENQRNAYIQEQIDEKRTVVELPELPYQGYLWDSTPNPDSMWGDRYKKYRGIDQNVELKRIKYSDWKKAMNK